MGEVKWSAEQRRIIDSRDTNLLISAAAGAGKTTVLVERILGLISDESLGIDVDRLLVVTFTKDAAAQMREKLADRLEKLVTDRPDDRRLLRQQMLLRNAPITTIDSFCNSVVKEYFHDIDIDPGFRIGEPAELGLLKDEVLQRLLEDCYTAHEQDFIDMTECLCPSRSDEGIEELILRLAKAADAQAWPLEWLDRLEAEFVAERDGRSGMKQEWSDYLTGYVHMMLSDVPERISEAMALCRLDTKLESNYLPALQSDEVVVRDLIKADGYDELAEQLGNVTFEKFKSIRDECDTDVKDRVTAIRKEYKDFITGLMKKFFRRDAETIAAELKAAAGPVITLITVTKEFIRRLDEAKRDRNIFDFSDIEHYALDILVSRDEDGGIVRRSAAIELNGRFAEIFVDEYQDSNFVQEQIICAIAGDNKGRPYTFMVGDVKQSIYKFRMAKPELFMNRFTAYRSDPEAGTVISLGRNFRSRPEVLDSTNDVFYMSMQKGVGGVTYDEEAALVCGQRELSQDGMPLKEQHRTEVILLSSTENDETINGSNAARRYEAEQAALRIRQLMDSGYMVGEGTPDAHRLGYGDIVVLLRSLKGWTDIYCEVFEAAGIPVYAQGSSAFLETYEIGVMTNYLRILDNPYQDIPLAAVMHSAIGEFTADELVDIRTFGGLEAHLWTALTTYAAEGEDHVLAAKAEAFLETYRSLRSMNLTRDINRVITAIYKETGFYLYCTALPGGDRRASNLDMLLTYASDYEAGSYSGLFSFVNYLEQIIKSDEDLEEAVSAEAGDSVRIMSIHKSKGLEFPVVIIGGMCKLIKNTDGDKGVIISSDFGIGTSRVDVLQRTKAPTIRRTILQLMMKLDNIGEELRLLYVAMTRAKQKLIMIGIDSGREGSKVAKREAAAARNLTAYPVSYIASVGSYMDLVYPVALMKPEHFTVFRSLKAETDAEGTAGNTDDETDIVRARVVAALESRKQAALHPADPGDSPLKTLLGYEYHYAQDRALPIKLSVSDIKRASLLEEGETVQYAAYAEPAAGSNAGNATAAAVSDAENAITAAGSDAGGMAAAHTNTGEITGSERGTLYHKVMRFLPFDLKGVDAVTAFLERLAENDIITAAERETVRAEDIAAFLQTDLAERLKKADAEHRLRREQPFVLGRRACDIDPVRYAGITDIIPVQGIIDCMFEENGSYCILDYKTDHVAAGEGQLLADRYRLQLANYADAVSKILKAKADEMLIYSFALREVIRV